ncbi:hypothetical protein N7492_007339 [Penicillium capsulatum]|uniref:Uncharacterized protein n=1 Tax=Penicillium capsulatum TaxID=69766 RepID=A0A9W9HZN8_9EURO|nr:hypothetical protein N7492_007339 [Penicillium capsulatum]KAJ6117179.1 hypothetical protein N7512_006904 [Penicillium capsulatum]
MSTSNGPKSQESTVNEDLLALTDIFSRLETAQTANNDPSDTIQSDADFPELDRDGFDNLGDDEPGIHTVSHNPIVKGFIPQARPNNLTMVPISPAREAFGLSHTTHTKWYLGRSNPVLSDFFRNSSDAPMHGFMTRVVQARLAAETGATPSRAPLNPAWDIRVVDKKFRAVAIQRFLLGYAPVYIPKDLPLAASLAMISLLVPGGAAAYTWRFRGSNDARAGYMPSYVRFRHPGGTAAVLAIYEEAPEQVVFGGSALTAANLKLLEDYYRDLWGHAYWDEAWKTVIALGAVYVDPVPNDRPLGFGFECVQQNTRHAGLDLRDHIASTPGPSPWGCPEVSMPFQPGIDITRSIRNSSLRAIPDLLGCPIPPDPTWVKSSLRRRVILVKSITPAGSDKIQKLDLFPTLRWLANPANGSPRSVALAAQGILNQLFDHTLAKRYMVDRYKDDEGKPYKGFRNVFGFDDKAVLALPIFDLTTAMYLLAGVHLPEASLKQRNLFAKDVPGKSLIDFDRIWDYVRVYALRLHISHALALVQAQIWPCNLHCKTSNHQGVIESLPPGMFCWTFVHGLSRVHHPALNWQLLEPIHYLRARDNKVAYYGYEVDGSWDVDDMGLVNVGSEDTNYPALDAALRHAWATENTVDVLGPLWEPFQPVLDTNGLIAPFGISPYYSYGWLTFEVSIFDTFEFAEMALAFGLNFTEDTVQTL